MILRKAADILSICERGLQSLVAEAANKGEYGSVQRIAELAKAISALAEETKASFEPSTGSLVKGEGGIDLSKSDAVRSRPTDGSAAAKLKSRVNTKDYPQFFRRGDELVKVGWSKKDRREYSHRAPRKAIDGVVKALRVIGAKGKLFNGDALLPLKDPSDGSAIPDYQGYVVLAWMKKLEIVEQRGQRSGYTLAANKPIDTTITSAWPALPEWRG